MICPYCKSSHGSAVINTRIREDGTRVYRRRECLNQDCMERFSTSEMLMSEEDVMNGRLQGMSKVHGRNYGKWNLKFTL